MRAFGRALGATNEATRLDSFPMLSLNRPKMTKSTAGRTALAMLLFPVCVLLLALISGLFTRFFLWMAPTAREYVMSLFSDSSIGISLTLAIGFVSWFVQRQYVRLTSRLAGIITLALYGFMLVASLVIVMMERHYYMAVVYTFLGIGQGIGLLMGCEQESEVAGS